MLAWLILGMALLTTLVVVGMFLAASTGIGGATVVTMGLISLFLTPPFGFALFYLRGVAPESVTTGAIYRGVVPFILMQPALLVALWFWPQMATWLPAALK
jgi:TRAP-type mannitol/chloroaromatic compound transport system permease large subunit